MKVRIIKLPHVTITYTSGNGLTIQQAKKRIEQAELDRIMKSSMIKALES